MKKTNYRHGEIGLFQIDKLPKDLTLSESKTIIKGSHSNSHTISQGELYFVNNDNVFGYLVAKNTILLHPEHGIKIKGKLLREAKIKDGIYELRKQVEFINKSLKQVID